MMSMCEEDTVKLVSAEGFEFFIARKAAIISHTLKSMLSCTSSSPAGTELNGEVIKFPEMRSPVLEKVCQYFYWSLQFSNGMETEFDIEPELTVELLTAANCLHT